MKVPGTEDEYFERPSVYVKYNDCYGYGTDVVKKDRNRFIYTE